jgi:hypothetical protein
MEDADTRRLEPSFVEEDSGEVSRTMVSENPVFVDSSSGAIPP